MLEPSLQLAARLSFQQSLRQIPTCRFSQHVANLFADSLSAMIIQTILHRIEDQFADLFLGFHAHSLGDTGAIARVDPFDFQHFEFHFDVFSLQRFVVGEFTDLDLDGLLFSRSAARQ